MLIWLAVLVALFVLTICAFAALLAAAGIADDLAVREDRPFGKGW